MVEVLANCNGAPSQAEVAVNPAIGLGATYISRSRIGATHPLLIL